ncbi:MAG: magnesium/cobalt transporter CorA [Ignavibacteriaceae bacterium]|nr:magnesium/cobalt transporter CorA [Ignavibacteriaceae bacterium]MCU0413890.1 magnesium/cobalt transporter CorA [Ignavibacteriaceae bacterium]
MKINSDIPKNILDVPVNLIKHLTPKISRKTSSKIGLPPGSIIHVGEQKIEKVKITLIEYDEKKFESCEIHSVQEIDPYTDTPQVTWVNVCGLHDTELIKQIGEKFSIHPLVLEDILNTETRPKIEVTDKYVFIAMKMLSYNTTTNEIETEQVSFILGDTFVFSFLEKSDSIFNPIKDRITNNYGRVRKQPSDYLFYALMDVVVDQYFLLLEQIEHNIETLDDEVITSADRSQIEKIYNLKNKLLLTRRSLWPLREIFSRLIREETPLINKKIMPYLRDLLDHTIQVTETIELQREITTGIMETHLSMMSFKMNEVMKVLTVIATIFIPLTFIVGIYGMNFPNMPEMKWPWAYFALWGVMIGLSVLMLYFFKKKKWF